MANLSDQNVLPDLINQTWTLYQQAQDDAQKARLLGQLQDLTQRLASLSDVTLDKTKQQYKNAVTAVQNATRQVKQAQQDQAKVAGAIGQIASVISALAKLAAMA